MIQSGLKSVQHGESICARLASVLLAHQHELDTQLIPDLSYIDVMAHNVKGIEILAVEFIDANQYRLRYSFDWQLFNGCAGIDESGVERDSVRFTLADNGDIELALMGLDLRSTGDEL